MPTGPNLSRALALALLASACRYDPAIPSAPDAAVPDADGPLLSWDAPADTALPGQPDAPQPPPPGLDASDAAAVTSDVAAGPSERDAEIPGATPSKCPGAFRLCDGFETSRLSPARWNPFAEAGSSVDIDSSRSMRGTSSVRLRGASGRLAVAGLHWNQGVPNPAYVRFFLFIPKEAPRFDAAFVSFDRDANEGAAVAWSDSLVRLESEPPTSLVTEAERVGLFQRDRWICVLVAVRSGPQGEVSLFVDDSSTPVLTSPLRNLPALNRLMFAISSDQAGVTRPLDLWIDEVAMGGTPITCAD